MIIKKLPTPGHGCDEVTLRTRASDLLIFYTFHDDKDTYTRVIEFDTVASFKFTTESHVDDFVSNAYESLVEIEESMWVAELKDPVLWPFERHHFAVSFGSFGYYEVLARSVSEREDEPSTFQG